MKRFKPKKPKTKLDPRPARQLTSREATKILSGTLGVLVDMAGPETSLEALTWLYENRHTIIDTLAAASASHQPPKGDPPS